MLVNSVHTTVMVKRAEKLQKQAFVSAFTASGFLWQGHIDEYCFCGWGCRVQSHPRSVTWALSLSHPDVLWSVYSI